MWKISKNHSKAIKCVGNDMNVWRKGFISGINVCILKCMVERNIIDPSNKIRMLYMRNEYNDHFIYDYIMFYVIL